MATFAENEVARLLVEVERWKRIVAQREAILANPPPGTTPEQLETQRTNLGLSRATLAQYEADLQAAQQVVATQATPEPEPPPPSRR